MLSLEAKFQSQRPHQRSHQSLEDMGSGIHMGFFLGPWPRKKKYLRIKAPIALGHLLCLLSTLGPPSPPSPLFPLSFPPSFSSFGRFFPLLWTLCSIYSSCVVWNRLSVCVPVENVRIYDWDNPTQPETRWPNLAAKSTFWVSTNRRDFASRHSHPESHFELISLSSSGSLADVLHSCTAAQTCRLAHLSLILIPTSSCPP